MVHSLAQGHLRANVGARFALVLRMWKKVS